MICLTRRGLLAWLFVLPVAHHAMAAPVPYNLEQQNTLIKFTFGLAGSAQTGTMPIQSAIVVVDPQKLRNSRVDVVLNVAKARTKLPFARGPMLSTSVLDAARFPTIRFVSTSVSLGAGGRISDGATITGNLTVRDVTRPIVLEAALYRPSGSAKDDLDHLSIHLTGALNRNDFGAVGYPDLVDETVGIDIRTEIRRKT
ncbi:MAG: YceI family protein [Ruegeria sp.]